MKKLINFLRKLGCCGIIFCIAYFIYAAIIGVAGDISINVVMFGFIGSVLWTAVCTFFWLNVEMVEKDKDSIQDRLNAI